MPAHGGNREKSGIAETARERAMNSVLNTLSHDHDLRLVMLAVVVCAFGAVSTMNISGRVFGRERGRLWLLLLAVCAGATVWATHFIAMLAYQAEIPPPTTSG